MPTTSVTSSPTRSSPINSRLGTKFETSVNEPIEWLDSSQGASKEEYEEKQKELVAITNPIMQKLYSTGGAPGGEGFPGAGEFPSGAGSFPGTGGEDGPSVQDVD